MSYRFFCISLIVSVSSASSARPESLPPAIIGGPAIEPKATSAFVIWKTDLPGAEGRFSTNSAPFTRESVILNGPSVISRTSGRLVIKWETDEFSTSDVRFGTNNNLANLIRDPQLVTVHRVTIQNLTFNATVKYVVGSIDHSHNDPVQNGVFVASTGNASDESAPVIYLESISSIRCHIRVVTTLAVVDTSALNITNVTGQAGAGSSRATRRLSWNTDRLGSSFVEYDTANAIGHTVGTQTVRRTHALAIPGLGLGKKHYIWVGSVNVFDPRAPAPTVLGPIDSIQTPTVADTTPPGTPDHITAIPGDGAAAQTFALRTNVPNPFKPTTTIGFELAQTSNVTLRVYNMLGQEEVALLDREQRAAGFHKIRWNG